MKMKKKMENPKIEIIVFEAMDIIATASGPMVTSKAFWGDGIDNENTVDMGSRNATDVIRKDA